MDKLKQTLKVCGTFKSYYFDYKQRTAVDTPENPWRFQNSALFSRLDLYLERCHDILDLCETVVQFNKLEKIEIGGTKGKTLTNSGILFAPPGPPSGTAQGHCDLGCRGRGLCKPTPVVEFEGRFVLTGARSKASFADGSWWGISSNSVRQVYADFLESHTVFKDIEYELLDVECKEFDVNFFQFRLTIKELERRLGAVISQVSWSRDAAALAIVVRGCNAYQ